MCWTSITGLPLAACNADILPKIILLSHSKYKVCEHFLWLPVIVLRCLYRCQSSFPMLQQWFRSWECLLSSPGFQLLWHWNALYCLLIPSVLARAQERGEALNRNMTSRSGKNLWKAEVVEGHSQIHTCILFEMWQLVKSEMGDGGREEKLKKKIN